MRLRLEQLGLAVVALVAACQSGSGHGSGDGDETGPGASAGDAADAADGDADDGDSDGDDDGGGSDDGEDIDPAGVLEPLVARLTDTQYAYTVLDVVGVALTDDERDALPTDIPIGDAYSTNAETQFFNAQYVLAYAEVARSVSARIDSTALLGDYGGCTDPVSPCLDGFIAGFGRRMFRRPLDGAERQRYLDLAHTIATGEGGSIDAVVPGLVQAMMQAPDFLYRIEHETDAEAGTVRHVDGYELASRLSYFLWQSAPDVELLTFAAGPEGDGAYDPSALPGQIDRMIADERFARARSQFWGDYTLASYSAFGTTDADLIAELRESLMATVQRMSGVDADPEPLSALFDGTELVMTPTVAALAGAESKGDGLQVYGIEETEQRLGVVTHPAFLASVGTTSFVGRGLFMTERLLCQHIAAPPDDIADQIMQTAQATVDMTPREASEFRFSLDPVCVVCHGQFEPVAYAFERYGLEGDYREVDDQGRALYSDGVLPAFGERPEIAFADAPELLAALAETDAVTQCMVENMTRFGTGRTANPLGGYLEAAHEGFADAGLTFDALARAVASSEQLTLMKAVEAAP